MDISIKYIDNKKYVALDNVAEFLEYKRVSMFISNIKKKATTIIQDILIEVSELLKLIRKNIKEKVSELYDILLKEEDKEEIKDIIDKFNEATDYKQEIKNKSNMFSTMQINLWYILSAFNLDIIEKETVNKFMSIYKINNKDLENMFIYAMEKYPYNPNNKKGGFYDE